VSDCSRSSTFADLGLLGFDTIMWNAKQTINAQRSNCVNISPVLMIIIYYNNNMR